MLGGGHLRGWKLSAEQVDALASALSRLASSEAMEIKYGLGGVAPLVHVIVVQLALRKDQPQGGGGVPRDPVRVLPVLRLAGELRRKTPQA